MSAADFLELPRRPPKPRRVGITHVLDAGTGVAALADLLRSAGRSADIWKAGWGTAYLDPTLREKLALLHGAQVATCLGGTLLEIAWAQGADHRCLDWAAEAGFSHVEVSRGTVAMPLAAKRALIRHAATRFTVLAEVGTKDPAEAAVPSAWRDEALGDLDAGADLVVAEGRQSGTVGIYDAAGAVRPEVVEALVAAVGAGDVVFEAPRAAQQAWFVRRFGPEVNLGNIAPGELLGVETLRLGLRSDTAHATARPTLAGRDS
ncbi:MULTISPECIES: phosphosulfolactate synthase [Pseudonocardia]|uniref:Phosphosulfolactate synthase n=2 Tax=Pseudonocardia TaxID=1847 RepID=A0A1Y2N7P5_PSEAH|nr:MULTISPECIES: phosphosulfolactate synthase [Pseudonocardia]OSY43476.1 Phosphosulfolactate synthase [Pseudonocardia autotrophica]TDN73530.1 phosphosulfolactate synthase [Pseudonocardia autotrophica]BBG04273.1 phosphosulfolactate synthase [Pseudonocardia autotrophica]GEC25584.1 phosphosulfolactate synthase [Pseudonocardia saturnea]